MHSLSETYLRGDAPVEEDGRVCSDWYRSLDGVGELGLERQVGSVSVFFGRRACTFTGVFLRPCVSDTVLGLCTRLLSLRRGFVDAAIYRRCCGFSAITTLPSLLRCFRSRSNQLVARSLVACVCNLILYELHLQSAAFIVRWTACVVAHESRELPL